MSKIVTEAFEAIRAKKGVTLTRDLKMFPVALTAD
jgi:hypothetical protein